MTVPPASTPPSSSSGGSRAERSPGESRSRKDFKLPKNDKDQKKEDEKKQGVFELAAEARSLSLQSGEKSAVQAATLAQGISPAALNKIAQLIQKMVSEIHLGELQGTGLASLKLADAHEVPKAFVGAELDLSLGQEGLAIHFRNFATPQQEAVALLAIEKNKQMLADLALNLQAKGIQLTELTVGAHTISLPRVDPLPTPLAVSRPTGSEAQLGEKRREQEKEGQGEEPA